MENRYKKSISSFMIVLILVMPFYTSSVFAQNVPFDNSGLESAAQSCVIKAEQNRELVETLDNGAITTLESTLSTLYFSCTAWSTYSAVTGAYRRVVGHLDTCVSGNEIQCGANTLQKIAEIPKDTVFEEMCNLVECRYADFASGLEDGTIKTAAEKAGEFQSLTNKFEINGLTAGVGPFDNIYTSIAQLCPTGILFNLRKLKTIYQTHSCCIQEACSAGISTESCDRQLSEATCMYWEGSLAQSFVKVMLSFLSGFIAEKITENVNEIIGTGVGSYLDTIYSLYNAYSHIQRLVGAFEWMTQSFSEPNCADLDFDDIKGQTRDVQRSRPCELVPVDDNGDGISDRIVPRC